MPCPALESNHNSIKLLKGEQGTVVAPFIASLAARSLTQARWLPALHSNSELQNPELLWMA